MDDTSTLAGGAWDEFEDVIRRFEDAWQGRTATRPTRSSKVPRRWVMNGPLCQGTKSSGNWDEVAWAWSTRPGTSPSSAPWR